MNKIVATIAFTCCAAVCVFPPRDGFAQWAPTVPAQPKGITSFASIGNTVYAGTKGAGVFVSTNYGASWKAMNTGLGNDTVVALLSTQTDLYAGTRGGVFQFDRVNTQWAAVNTGLSNMNVQSLIYDGTNIFAATDGGKGVYRSTNGGGAWTALDTGLTNSSVFELEIVEYKDGESVFAGTKDSGVYRSTDLGLHWKKANGGSSLDSATVDAFAAIDTVLFAGTMDGGVYRSPDKGATWTAVNGGLSGNGRLIAALAVVDTQIFAATMNGLYVSKDSGNTWTALVNGLNDSVITAFASVGGGSNITYFAGSYDGAGVYVSANGGTSWTPSDNGLNLLNVVSFGIDNTDGFAGTKYGGTMMTAAIDSENWGWSAVNGGVAFNGQQVNAFAVTANGVFAGTNGSGAFRSTDNGAAWNSVNTGLSDQTVNALIAAGVNLFAATPSGVFFSPSNGTNWFHENNGLPAKNVTALAAFGNLVFAGTDGAIYMTDNNGGKWAATGAGFSGTCEALIAVPNPTCFTTAGMLLAAGSGGIYQSLDSGATWNKVWSLTGAAPEVHALAAVDGIVFAGTESGVYFSTDCGAAWTAANGGLGSAQVFALAASGKWLLAGSPTTAWRRKLTDFNIVPLTPVASLSPVSLSFTIPATAPAEYSDTIVVSNSGTASLSISNVVSTDSTFSLIYPDTVPAGGTGNIVVTYHYNGQQGGISYLYVSTNDPVHPVDTVSITVTVLKPQIMLDRDTVVFDIAGGVTATYTDSIKITNAGNVSLNISNVSVNDASFTVSAPVVVPAGTSVELILTLHGPTSAGDKLLLISSNDPRQPVDSVLIVVNVSGAVGETVEPKAFDLSAYPDPADAAAEIGFTLPAARRVSLALYDALGVRVATLAQGWMDAGTHNVFLKSGALRSGVYFYRLTVGNSISAGAVVIRH